MHAADSFVEDFAPSAPTPPDSVVRKKELLKSIFGDDDNADPTEVYKQAINLDVASDLSPAGSEAEDEDAGSDDFKPDDDVAEPEPEPVSLSAAADLRPATSFGWLLPLLGLALVNLCRQHDMSECE